MQPGCERALGRNCSLLITVACQFCRQTNAVLQGRSLENQMPEILKVVSALHQWWVWGGEGGTGLSNPHPPEFACRAAIGLSPTSALETLVSSEPGISCWTTSLEQLYE